MKKENKTLVTPEGHKITFRERESVEINLNLPKDTLELLEIIAQKRICRAYLFSNFSLEKV